ncbi:MAG: polysaccharide deacetylase family protein [Endomicrobia bacterium]|nr:polysaccharide deacetylase family protein [Endomicrobiia bacterium]
MAEENFVWKINTDQKIIFLTFDDGPSRIYTLKVLEILDKYNINAVFFVLGVCVKGNEDIIKLIINKGNILANHTYNHYNYYQLVKQKTLQECKNLLSNEIIKTETELKKILGDNFVVNYLRMPNGYCKKWVQEIALKFNYKLVNWTFGYDWHNVSYDEMYKKYCNALQPGAIFLFHDGGKNREKTIEVLEKFIEYCLQKGYKFGNLKDWIKK